MICVGIDVVKDKHDCFIISSEGEVLADVFAIQNNADGFDVSKRYACASRYRLGQEKRRYPFGHRLSLAADSFHIPL